MSVLTVWMLGLFVQVNNSVLQRITPLCFPTCWPWTILCKKNVVLCGKLCALTYLYCYYWCLITNVFCMLGAVLHVI